MNIFTPGKIPLDLNLSDADIIAHVKVRPSLANMYLLPPGRALFSLAGHNYPWTGLFTGKDVIPPGKAISPGKEIIPPVKAISTWQIQILPGKAMFPLGKVTVPLGKDVSPWQGCNSTSQVHYFPLARTFPPGKYIKFFLARKFPMART